MIERLGHNQDTVFGRANAGEISASLALRLLVWDADSAHRPNKGIPSHLEIGCS